ncbi:MAG: 5'-nucleotidase C-terminal domain-containing protein [Chitinophagales bacterium]|nr:5'-nucleotidase C-terminal domain-containing protein [Chitinophagales bacterium]
MMLKRYFKIVLSIIFFCLITTACKTFVATQEQFERKAIENLVFDTSIVNQYQPYKDSLDKSMKVKIATLQNDVVKAQPSSTLTNLLADILFEQATKYIKQPIDFAVMNYGGIRLPSLSKGDLLVEHAYQLMPFDNYIVALQLNGTQVQELCNSIAKSGGWPVSHIQFTIDDANANNIQINNEALQNNKLYTVAMIDYIANGGDNMTMLKTITQIPTGVLLRNGIIDYFKTKQIIIPDDTKRIQHAE